MEPKGSLPHSQVPATCPYPEPVRSSPYPHIPLLEDSSSYYPPIYTWVSKVVSLPQVSPPKPCIRLFSPHMCYMPCPSHSSWFYDLNNLGEQYRSLIPNNIVIIIGHLIFSDVVMHCAQFLRERECVCVWRKTFVSRLWFEGTWSEILQQIIFLCCLILQICRIQIQDCL